MGWLQDFYGTPPDANGREICPWCKWPLEDFGGGRYECTNKKHAGGIYYKINGELKSNDEINRSQGIRCRNCGQIMKKGTSSLPYENGNNSYATMRCEHCGYENIFDGFGFDDD